MTDIKYLPVRVLRSMINAVHDAVVITTAEAFDKPHPQIIYVNQAFTAISGYTAEEAIGQSPRMLQGPGTDRAALSRIRQALMTGQSCQEEILNYHKNGSSYWLDVHIVPLYGEDDKITHFAAIERDVTQQRRRLKRLESLAHQDFLTGLANRAALYEHIEELTATDPLAAHTFVLFDLDGFKLVNDTLGHLAGDALLQKFAAILVANVRRDDFVARLGGDEFALVLRNTDLVNARTIIARMLADARRLNSLDPSCGNLAASAGVTTFRGGGSIENIMASADDALYSAKREGKGIIRISRPRLLKKIA